jgi:hypothetical protein
MMDMEEEEEEGATTTAAIMARMETIEAVLLKPSSTAVRRCSSPTVF